MNHLAHFLLCPSDDELRAGTLIADHVRGSELGSFTPGIERGIRLHRRIDALVDSSPQVTGLKPLVEAPLRRYAGILFDVFFDYVLIREWHQYGPAPLDQFKHDIYASLAASEPGMPETTRLASARMRQYDALGSCATHAGCRNTLARISGRLKRPVALEQGVQVLVEHECRIADAFAALFPGLQRSAEAGVDAGADRSLPGRSQVPLA